VKRTSLTAAVAATTMLLVGGCGGVGNAGGDTTCRTFLAANDTNKDATVAKMLKARNGRNASTGDVVYERKTLDGLCKPADKQDVKIADLG
jgi:acid stress chaperone HdeA